ncbi:hypothetical protein C2U72_20790 [Prosthecomicrobium hirschii]|uniref:hypothetical protein n=1 Tax=Prosthecodimorpha hirschii TaxID=665126 RepID=UPI001125D34A|nr:hypothetical protein [Prosthecomicrobium hirschii]TPQ49008.1 hypothetical protein C2U72_20790 [Prosthecomicrobium hirschii]
MSRFVSVERLSADTLFARATSPEAGLDADARDLAEEPARSSAALLSRIVLDLIAVCLFLVAAIVWLGAAAGTL